MAKNPQCDEFQDLINELLDCSLDPADDLRVSEHAHSCHDCQAILSQYRQMELLTRFAFRSIDDDCFGNAQSQNQKGEGFDTRPIRQLDLDSVGLNGETAYSGGRHVLPKRPIRTILGTLAASVLVLVFFERPSSLQPEHLNVASTTSPSSSENSPSKDLVAQDRTRPATRIFTWPNCYEITSELPGIRPIRSSVDATLNMLHQIVPAEFRLPQSNKPLGHGDGDRVHIQVV
ncbi:MAG: zf-HC2 domain-containing protein [Pirellulaceae bacterium]|jgi:hypothetical protein|nr:zf-HC2 domain-containing protein [Pirellulaceae bacterium]